MASEHQATRMDVLAKAAGCAKAAGREVIGKALQLFYALGSPHTPAWARAVITSALVYFISPADAIPDLIPGVGYVDDLGVIAAALATIGMHITPEIRKQAEDKARRIFGDD